MIPAPMDRAPLLAHHVARGVRLADRPEAPGFAAPLAFGDVPAEYRAARAGCGLLDVSDRGRLTVRGKDAADFLHRLLANHVKPLAPGAGNANLLLSPKGKVLFVIELTRRADRFELGVLPGSAAALGEALERFHFAEDVAFEDTSAGYAPLEVVGSQSGALLARVLGAPHGAPIGLAPHASVTQAWRGGELTVRGLPGDAWRLDAGPARVVELWEALAQAGATPCGLVVRDSLRVESGRALAGVDVDDNVYPQEAGLDDAFALDKGCYVGQEVVATIDTYGGLNKRLCVLRVEHSDPVPRGTPLVLAEDGERRELGLVTTWAYSFDLDSGAVLAYVKRRHQEPGTRFDLGEAHGVAVIVAPRT
jgi:aminomethyltransferase